MQLNEMAMSNSAHFPNMFGQHTTRPDGTPITVYYFSTEGT